MVTTSLKLSLYLAAIAALASAVPGILRERSSVMLSVMSITFVAACLREKRFPSWFAWSTVVMIACLVISNLGIVDDRWWRLAVATAWLALSLVALALLLLSRKQHAHRP
jgi:hypothetical protein